MKTLAKVLFALSFALIFASCATNYQVQYQVESRNTGSITLKPSSTTSKTNVTINDNLVLDNKNNVKSVRIDNVPAGEHTIVYASESSTYKTPLHEEINAVIEPGKQSTKLVQVPPTSGGYWAYLIILAAIPIIILNL